MTRTTTVHTPDGLRTIPVPDAIVDADGRLTPGYWFDLAKAYARAGFFPNARSALALALYRLRENTGHAVAWAPKKADASEWADHRKGSR